MPTLGNIRSQKLLPSVILDEPFYFEGNFHRKTKNMKLTIIRLCAFLLVVSAVNPLVAQKDLGKIADLNWKNVATHMPEEWYGSDEAKAVTENVLFCQYDNGGWAKNKPYHHALSNEEKAAIAGEKAGIGATIDNGATITELNFLARVYTYNKDERIRASFLKGVNYLFISQYPNGGWPQFYPFRKGKIVAYASHITYNDNAMVNVMNFLKALAKGEKLYTVLNPEEEVRAKALIAFSKGVECILRSQIIVNGRPTVWCAQHDEFTLLPANARAYELVSFSGSESVGITLLLMEMENPSQEIINAVKGAVSWFEDHKIEGIKLKSFINRDSKKDLEVVQDNSAPPLWSRFYDLETGKPFFCDRDGIKRNTLAEIGYERRNGYSWYTDAPSMVMTRFPDWLRRWQ
jgi:PelA/Pel-15E family pectate lyase